MVQQSVFEVGACFLSSQENSPGFPVKSDKWAFLRGLLYLLIPVGLGGYVHFYIALFCYS